MLMLRHFLGQPPTITLEQRNGYLEFIRVGREKLLGIPAELPDLGTDAAEFQGIVSRMEGYADAIEAIRQKLMPEGEEPASLEEYPALTPDERTTLTQWNGNIDRMVAIVEAHGVPSPVAGAKLDTGTIVAGAALVTAGILVVTLS